MDYFDFYQIICLDYFIFVSLQRECMEQKNFKYQKQIDKLLTLGCQLPLLYVPDDMKACRFAFSDSKRKNHLPQYMSNPKRMLQDVAKGKATTSLLSLSCFTTPNQAEIFYRNLTKAFRNISVSIGDSLAEGTLRNEDGMKTATSNNGHFDFYEYENCDLNNTFQLTKTLCDNENSKRI